MATRCASSSAASSHSRFLATALTTPRRSASLGVEPPTGEHQLHRPLLADRAGQPLGPAAAGDDPERDLGLAELGRLRGDDQVADERQLAAAPEGPARDRGDQRRPAVGQPAPEARPRGERRPRGTRARRARRCRRRRRTTSSEPAITMQRTSGSASKPSTAPRAPPSTRARARCAPRAGSGGRGRLARRPRSRRVGHRARAHQPSGERSATSGSSAGIIALIPVASRPMISFWICDVPSYRVVTRASRR